MTREHAEVAQRCSKAVRFGLDERQPVEARKQKLHDLLRARHGSKRMVRP